MEYDTLDFKIIDPRETQELWARDWYTGHNVTEIYINNQEIVDMLRPIEEKILKSKKRQQLMAI